MSIRDVEILRNKTDKRLGTKTFQHEYSEEPVIRVPQQLQVSREYSAQCSSILNVDLLFGLTFSSLFFLGFCIFFSSLPWKFFSDGE